VVGKLIQGLAEAGDVSVLGRRVLSGFARDPEAKNAG
jgi:hypothetical protein